MVHEAMRLEWREGQVWETRKMNVEFPQWVPLSGEPMWDEHQEYRRIHSVEDVAQPQEVNVNVNLSLGAGLKDHEIAEVVNQLRDIAVEFHGAQQLRERIAHVVVPLLKGRR